jgi:hypothetical protein
MRSERSKQKTKRKKKKKEEKSILSLSLPAFSEEASAKSQLWALRNEHV